MHKSYSAFVVTVSREFILSIPKETVYFPIIITLRQAQGDRVVRQLKNKHF
jgi:hypothetical protein